jgi:hypothetical protein
MRCIRSIVIDCKSYSMVLQSYERHGDSISTSVSMVNMLRVLYDVARLYE